MKRTGSLFHTIVVVGAALAGGAGCGDDEHRSDAAPQVADARPADARVPDATPADAGTDAGTPDAMIIIL